MAVFVFYLAGTKFAYPKLVSETAWTSVGLLKYDLYIPKTLKTTKDAPLVIALHGGKHDASEFARITGLNDLAEKVGAVVLYPHQEVFRNFFLYWNWYQAWNQFRNFLAPWSPVDLELGELAAIKSIVDDVVETYELDPKRKLILGLSAGAAMACNYANCYPSDVAAVALHSGVGYLSVSDPFTAEYVIETGEPIVSPEKAAEAAYQFAQKIPGRVRVLVIVGNLDERVNPQHSRHIAEEFRVLNSFIQGKNIPQLQLKETVHPPEKHPYRVEETHDCQGSLIRLITVENLGHAWSGGAAGEPYSDPMGPNATQMIWDFFTESNTLLHTP